MICCVRFARASQTPRRLLCRSAGVARDCLHDWVVGASFSGSSQFAVLHGGNEKVPEDLGVER